MERSNLNKSDYFSLVKLVSDISIVACLIIVCGRKCGVVGDRKSVV